MSINLIFYCSRQAFHVGALIKKYTCVGFALSVLCIGFSFAFAPLATAAEPIGIAVIAPSQRVLGKAIVNAANLAVDDINANGGVNGRQLKLYQFDDNFSSANAVRAFQKAVQQDHVVAGVGGFVDEVVLALEPWAGRLQTPFIVTGAIAPERVSRRIHEHYAKYKYMFMDNPDGSQQAKSVCQSLHDTVVQEYGARRAVILAEDANWTRAVVKAYQKCLPKAGLTVLKTVQYSVKTTDFTPIYTSIEKLNPQVIVAATAINGLRPIVQWHQSQVPALLAGINAEAIAESFWERSNKSAQGVLSVAGSSINGVAITPKTVAFFKAYEKRFGTSPPFSGYTTYDAVHLIAQAIGKGGSTKGDSLVKELESLRYVGANGNYQFYGQKSPRAHEIKVGADYIPVPAFQCQNGEEVVIWPPKYAGGKVELPSFVKPVFKNK